MKALFREIWVNDRRAFVRILCMNIMASLLGGIGIVMLIPLLHMLDIGAGEAEGLLAVLGAPMADWPYTARVLTLLAIYILLVTLKALLGRALAIRENAFVEDTGLRLRGRLYDAVASASWEQISASRNADTINLFTAQCSQVSYGISEITHMLAGTVSAAIQLGIALWMNVPITIIVCLLGGVMLMIFRPLRKKSRAYGQEMIQINRDFYAELQNQLSSVKEVRAYGVEKEHEKLFSGISASFKEAHQRYTRMYTVPSVVYSIAAAVLIAAVYLISALVLQVETARLVVLVYVFARLWPLFSGWQGQLQYIHSCVPAYEKLTEAIAGMNHAREAEPAGEMGADFHDWQEIRFDKVSFQYQGAETPTLQSADLVLRKGSVTALLGRNGAGKTTMANLLLGFLSPTEGAITVDGVALDGRNIRAWRRMAGYVPQDPLILNASVRENLRRFHPQATEEDIKAALKTAMAWDFVSALPEGLDTQLGDRGVRLSGGERQRIVLARVLIGKPRLIILDEATSALDYESENAFREVIRAMSGEAAVVMIAHRLATIRMAEQAIVLENGVIAEQGSMAELLSRPGSYLSGMVNVE